MKQKKTMQLWQMLALMILSAIVLITMFLPAYHINGKAVVKMYNKMVSSEMMDLAEQLGGMDMDAVQEELDEEIAKAEEENGIKISSITPFRIMTNSYLSFLGVESDEDISSPELAAVYAMQRAILWVVYILAVIVIIILLLGFCLKWTKYISLIISMVYGLIGSIIFAVFQFVLPNIVAKNISAQSFGGLGALGGLGLGSMDSMMAKMISCLWGIAYLIAFIIFLLMLIVSVASMFTGNAKSSVSEQTGAGYDVSGSVNTYAEQSVASQPEIRKESNVVSVSNAAPVQTSAAFEAAPQPAAPPQPRVEPAMPPMGQVRCTKGVAAGQGFSLPEDRKVVVGKSSQSANMVLAHPNVSKIHCSIRFKAATNSYIVKDHSLNGTFVNGVRLQKDAPMELPAGTTLTLADGSNEIKLG